MKIVVIYDSLYGNTRTIAETIAAASAPAAQLLHVGEVQNPRLADYDLLIFGAPTQGANASPPMKELLDAIPAGGLRGLQVAAFDTRMEHKLANLFGFAAPKIASSLKKKGGLPVGNPEGFWVTGGEGPLAEGEIERATAWAKEIARLAQAHLDR